MTPSDAAHIVSVFERDRKLLEYLDGLGIVPGAAVDAVARNYDETFTLQVGGKEVQLGAGAAQKVWVERNAASGVQ